MIDTTILRRLRERIAQEHDPQKIYNLCGLLGALIREDDAQIALRFKVMRKRFELLFGPAAVSTPELPPMDLEDMRPDAEPDEEPHGTRNTVPRR